MSIAKSSSELLSGIVQRIRNQKLRSKLFLVFLLAAIVPVSYLVLYSYQTVKDQLIRQAESNVGSTMDQVNKNIENTLDNYKQASTLIYLDTQLRNYLLNDYGANDLSFLDAYDYINKTLYKMMAINSNLKSITIYTDNHSLHTDGFFIKYMEDLPQSLKDQTQKAAGNITLFFANRAGAQGNNMTLARSLNYLSLNYPYGILTMEITERELHSLIEKENNNKTIIVADSEGNIITSGLPDRKISNLAQLSEMDSRDTMVFEKSMKYGWKTVVLLPYSELLGPAQRAAQNILYTALACIAAAIVLIYATSKFMTKRIEILLQQIRKVERGSFDLTFRPMGHDEIGQLSFALNKMASKMTGLIQDIYRQELAKNEAEMSSLQAQINPHFLYNTLASISALALKNNNPQVHRMADDLARFYRISLNKGKKSITIEREIKLTEHYLSIQQTRFRNLFKVHSCLDESLYPYTTLKLILQPFIENCINHAIWDDESCLNIVLKLESEGDDIVFSVIDDGMGIPEAVCRELNQGLDEQQGFGIFNVNKRIQLAFGAKYGVKIYSRLGIGTSVKIRFPKTSLFV
ncbi:sensor histidine kinase [Cohnella candidum]|nr:sensor histidine kinase [Cohnella candidum]